MRKRWSFLAGFAAAALIARWQLARFFTESPDYEVEERLGRLEIRRYPARVVAETRVHEADWDRALSEGFRRLARYIFGGNSGRGERIAMTAPVNARAERIAMTSPVNASRDSDSYTITFTMPRDRTIESLPVPDDSQVVLKDVPATRVAALRFRGRYDARNVARASDELRELVAREALHSIGEVQFAGYDPPSTLPLLRRNEVWVEIDG